MGKQKRWVYGTRTDKWYLVGSKDRDYIYGIPQHTMKTFGKDYAKRIYLRHNMLKNVA